MYMHMIRTIHHMHGGCFSNPVYPVLIGHREPTMQAIMEGGVLVSCSTNYCLNPLPRHLFIVVSSSA